MSSIGFDSCFYDRLDQFSKSLNHVLLATKRNSSLAAETDWAATLELGESPCNARDNFPGSNFGRRVPQRPTRRDSRMALSRAGT